MNFDQPNLTNKNYLLIFQIKSFIQVDENIVFKVHVSLFFDFNIISIATKNNIIVNQLLPNPMEGKLIFCYNYYYYLMIYFIRNFELYDIYCVNLLC